MKYPITDAFPARCEKCGKTEDLGKARFAADVKLILCGQCWVNTPPPGVKKGGKR